MQENKKRFLKEKTILITGGTGSFGSFFVSNIINNYPNIKKIIVYSRDEFKQYIMKKKLENHKLFEKIRFFIGDVRDKDRLQIALRGVDIVIHAAALKQIDTAEYNPTEFVNTNIIGTQNLIECSISENIEKIILVSTDKACSPANLYGATKLCAEKLIISANQYAGKRIYSVVRYGNVFNSRGSIFPLFKEQSKSNLLTITDAKMTRFNISLSQAYETVMWSIFNTTGGEIVIPKLPSYTIMDLAKAMNPTAKIKFIGIRAGEKVHEDLISDREPGIILESKNFYVISDESTFHKNKYKGFSYNIVKKFTYNSGTNKNFMSVKQIKNLVKNI